MNFRTGFISLIIISLVGFYACREDFDFEQASESLRFNTDTLSLDTVFTNYNSETFVIRVFNNQDEDVLIPRIYLERGADSFYKVNVDGQPLDNTTGSIENVPIRANDSLFVFVEIAVPEVNTQQYEEDLWFETNEMQNVKLVSWIEQTTYYLPEEGSNDVEITETVWDNNTVKFISGNARTTNGLTIEAGTKIYFFNDASLEVGSNQIFNVNGTEQEKVIFRSHRHTPRYDSLPDQWNRVLVTDANVQINHAKIIGGKVGLQAIDNAIVNISNSEVYNNQDFGLQLSNSTVNAQNLVVNNSNLASVFIDSGGDYTFTHCTIGNFFDLDAGPTIPLFLSNINDDGQAFGLDAVFRNSIFYGRSQNGVQLDIDNNNSVSTYHFENCVIRNNNTAILDVSSNSNFNGTITENPMFIDVQFGINNLRLMEESTARSAANQIFANQFPLDIDGNSRTTNPDIGAYQNQ